MNDQINYANNPLHGVGLKDLLTEMVDHYGFEILNAYLNINCFKTKPSIESSLKFLKKTDWAREKVEAFYMYQYKNLPNPSSTQFSIPPRDRIVPESHKTGAPAELSLEDAERLQEEREKKAAERKKNGGSRFNSGKKFNDKRSNNHSKRSDNAYARSDDNKPRENARKESNTSNETNVDPWAKWKK
ncbi:VF530 family protein [Litoribacillus peritrichatus]|uniref:DUF2132 domain-containing protein n=1 Tax=Litoribacillus peritrichatus TaxID=718191 RepID=A0ABP7MBU6_9GAMM